MSNIRRKFLRRQIKAGKIKKPSKKINWLGFSAILIAFFALAGTVYFYSSPVATEFVFGKVTMLNDTTSTSGSRRWVVVKLKDGRFVQVALPKQFTFEKGATVKLRKVTTGLFGAERFRFAGYQKNQL
ncbi:MAG: hypothetical protein SD837_19860 [Candidatus Electrothrix scaldis]|nr:MAG: hypothetical protein SD837_19860 [Candidatus Electrothrix sp. GW3-3]